MYYDDIKIGDRVFNEKWGHGTVVAKPVFEGKSPHKLEVKLDGDGMRGTGGEDLVCDWHIWEPAKNERD